MARPIKETPTLTGKDAKRFIDKMQNVKPISIKERQRINENYLKLKRIFVE